MNRTRSKIISLLICLGILAACSPIQISNPVSTTPVIPTGVVPSSPNPVNSTEVVQSSQNPVNPTGAVQSSPAVGPSWEFDSDGNAEGWVATNEITGLQVSQGSLTGQSTGTDPFLFGPQGPIDANSFSSIEIRMKTTAGSAGQIYFTTSSDTPFGFNAAESILFMIIPDGQFHTYVLDMSTLAGWKGTITELRLDPGDTPATFEIDYIRILKSIGLSWEFENPGNTEGWVATNEITGLQVSQGYLTGQSTGTDPFMFGPQVPIDAKSFSSIEIRMETNAGAAGLIFFTTSSDTPFDFNADESLLFTITPDGQFHTYVLDMSTLAGWKGTITELRLNPDDTPATFDIDYIRIMKQ